MMYWIAILVTPLAIGLFMSARAHRANVLAARSDAIRCGYPADRPVDPESIAALGEMVTPIVLCAIAYLALKTCLAFYLLNNGALSIFDLAGTLLLMGTYGTWLKIKTSYRMPSLNMVGLNAEAATKSDLVGIKTKTSGQGRPPVRQRVGARVQMLPARPDATATALRGAQLTFAPESLR